MMNNAAQNGTAYYRLKMTDKDGRFSYSNVLKVMATSKTGYNLYPNPVKGELTVNIGDAAGGKHAAILTLAGKKLIDISLENGVTTKKIAVANLLKGQYLFIVTNADGKASTQQFNKD